MRVLALKKAEGSDETIIRMVELDGKPLNDVRVSFAAPVAEAREVNAQEQPTGSARVSDGALLTSFMGYQPRTFAVRLGAPSAKPAVFVRKPLISTTISRSRATMTRQRRTVE